MRHSPDEDAPRRAARAPRMAYVMSRFPKLTETFVLYEILALEALGIPVEVYPLLRERQPVAHPEAEAWLRRARFQPFLSLDIVRANAHFLRRDPARYLRMVRDVLRHTWGSANFFVGAIGILPKTVRFAREMEQRGVTHVHAHFATHPALAALIVHRLTGIPYSFTAHGSDLHVDRRMLDVKVAESAFAVTVSAFNREVMVAACGERLRGRIHVVRCGVDTAVFQPVPRRDAAPPLRIVCVASFEEVKGHRHLVEACRLLRDRGVAFRCDLVGTGPLRRDVMRRIADAGLQHCVLLRGGMPRPDVARLVAEAHVAVLASVPTQEGKREGIPVALMEAMACGLPVVSTAISGIPELVESGRTGYLVPPGRADLLADRLQTLAQDPKLRASLGAAGRQKVLAEYDIRRNTRQLLDLFQSVARPASGPAHPLSPAVRTMSPAVAHDAPSLAARLDAVRKSGAPALSIAIPVNAQGDLENVLLLLEDIAAYRGPRAIEVVLIVNNYPPDSPPPELDHLRALGVTVLAQPSVRQAGEAVGFSGRVLGARAAAAPYVVFFDADCRIPDATSLLDWYGTQLDGGAHAAYTWVTYVDCVDAMAVRVKLAIHHASRWFKRVMLGIPTTQGCNYAVRRDSLLELYTQGYLADEMNVGPTFKTLKGPVAYSRARRLHVLTSGRMFTARWRRIIPYFTQRLLYNLRVIPVRPGVARRTGRERDPVRRYVNNRPVRDETEASAARR